MKNEGENVVSPLNQEEVDPSLIPLSQNCNKENIVPQRLYRAASISKEVKLENGSMDVKKGG